MKKSVKNPYISLMKLAASCLVVLAHITFSGNLGYLMESSIVRIAVPFFCAISGYYSYNTNANRFPKRIKKLFFVLLFTVVFYLFCLAWSNNALPGHGFREYLASLISIEQAARYILLDDMSGYWSFHMWYISAEIKVYAALLIYETFTDNRHNYKPLYLMAASAFMFFIAFGINSVASGQYYSVSMTRNSLFYVFPMFMLGVFLHQYEKIIIERFRLTKFRLMLVIIAGFMISLLECYGIGKSELPLGMLPVVSALILLLTGFPIPDTALTDRLTVHIQDLETMSLIVYIVHSAVNLFCLKLYNYGKLDVSRQIYPLVVLAVSVGTAILCCLIRRSFSFIMRKVQAA